MKEGTNAEHEISEDSTKPGGFIACKTPPAKDKKRAVSTNALISDLARTLDTAAFLERVKELDVVTQRQCLLRAARALAGSGVVRLHGSRAVRRAIQKLRTPEESS